MAKVSRPFRDKMFLLVVRNHVANGLVSQFGYSRGEARQASHELADTLIEEAAAKVAGTQAFGAGGGLIAFLLAFIQSPLFAQLIALLLSLFGGPPVAIAPTDAPA